MVSSLGVADTLRNATATPTLPYPAIDKSGSCHHVTAAEIAAMAGCLSLSAAASLSLAALTLSFRQSKIAKTTLTNDLKREYL